MDFSTQNMPAFQNFMSRGTEIAASQNDPIYQMLVRRKKNGEDTQLPPTQEFPQEDIDALSDFCQKNGIFGFNFGRMNPKAALMMLKSKMGVPMHNEVSVQQTRQLIKG
jgi:hypothetical protein